MVWLGIVLMLIGFVLIMPRGALAGSAAIRNVPMPSRQLVRTPGYQPAPTGRIRAARLVIGGVCLIVGFAIILVVG